MASKLMKTNIKLLTEQRQQKILELLQERGMVSVEALVTALGVSSMTVWRDLAVLDQSGKVRRVRGGVMKGEEASSVEPFYKSKQVVNKEKKRVIARFAAEHFVEDNDIIILEAGTTAGAMIPFLKQSNLTVLSNGLGNLNDLSCCVPHISVLGCGGILRSIAYTFVGPQAEDFFRGIRARTLFLSATGLALPEGITDPNPLETQVKRAMAQSAGRIILLLDSSKFGVRSLTPVIPLEKIHSIITDVGAPQDHLDNLQSLGIEVLIAS